MRSLLRDDLVTPVHLTFIAPRPTISRSFSPLSPWQHLIWGRLWSPLNPLQRCGDLRYQGDLDTSVARDHAEPKVDRGRPEGRHGDGVGPWISTGSQREVKQGSVRRADEQEDLGPNERAAAR